MVHNGTGARRFPRDGHTGRVPAELSDVLLHPLEGEPLVEEAHVELAASRLHASRGQEPESPQPVLDLDGDERVVVGADPLAGVVLGPEDRISAAVWQLSQCKHILSVHMFVCMCMCMCMCMHISTLSDRTNQPPMEETARRGKAR